MKNFKKNILILLSILLLPPSLIAAPNKIYTFFNDTDEYNSLSFYYTASRGSFCMKIISPHESLVLDMNRNPCFQDAGANSCNIHIHQSKDCSEPEIAKMGIEDNKGIIWVGLKPRQPKHKYAFRVTYEASTNNDGQDIHIAKSMHYLVKNNLYTQPINMNINSKECRIYIGSLMAGHDVRFFWSNNMWDNCKNNRTSCEVTINELIKTEKGYICGPLVGTVLLDVDKGIKSVINNPFSMYKLDTITTPGFGQIINIK